MPKFSYANFSFYIKEIFKIQIVDLLDQEISEEVIEKTTQLEQRQKAMRDEFKV